MKKIAVMVALAGAAAVASAQTPAVVSFSGGSAFDSYWGSASGDVVGYRFTADVDLTITHLGGLNADD